MTDRQRGAAPASTPARLLAGVAAAALLAMPAMAQQAPAQPGAADAGSPPSAPARPALPSAAEANPAPEPATTEEIVVTGTSIRGVAPVGAPVLGLSQKDIQNQPVTTTTELVRLIPSVTSLGASENFNGAANNANANITGGNGINLRGLGTEATLTLLNGRRLPPAGTQAQFFDPSIIPTAAIGRLEVMADGGSAIYGSDAVGGVVNILLRRDFEGVEANVRYGFNREVNQQIYGLIAGHNWGSGRVMIAYEHNERTPLRAEQRERYTDDLRRFGGTDQRSFNSNPGNIQVGGNRFGIPAGQNGTGLTAGRLTAPNRQSAYLGADAIPGQNRDSVIGSASQEITPAIKIWAEGFYAKRKLDRSTGAQSANLTVPRSNPYFVSPNPAAASVTVNYSFYDDFGPTRQDAFQEAWDAAGGVDIDLGGSWNASAYASYGRDDEGRTVYAINNAQLTAALRDTNPLTAFNPFGDGSFTNPATLARLLGYNFIGSRYDLQDYGLKVDGSLFSLPGGEVKLAVGGEYQDHTLRSLFSNNIAGADVATIIDRQSKTKRDVKSVYGEVFVPLFSGRNAVGGIEELSLSAAIRHDDYSDFGGTTNPKFAVRYKPVRALALRGTYGRSFRAPTLSDIDPTTATISVQDFTDPTAATGVTRTLWVRGGSGDLGPERATIWSLGGDLEPAFVPGLNLSLTYFNVDYKNRIETPGNDTLALTPARAALLGPLVQRNPSAALVLSFLNSPFYTGLQENPANVLAFVDGRKVNVGRVRTDGLEGVANYAFDLGGGRATVGGTATHILRFKRSSLPTLPLTEVVNTINNPLSFRARGTLGWSDDRFGANLFVNYAGRYRNNSVAPVQRVRAYTTADLSLRYTMRAEDGGRSLLGGTSLTFDVQNVTDTKVPIVYNGTLAFDPQISNILGRFFLVGVRKTW
ncbi:MAG: TonB-dependent receptor [Sphingomonas fennica]